MATDDGMCSLLVYLLLSSVSLALHSSIKTGEKNGCNRFLTLFLNTSLHHLHRSDRTLISHLQKPGENETNCDPPSSSGTELSGPVTHLTFVALNTLLNTYSVTFMKEKTHYIILYILNNNIYIYIYIYIYI